MTLVLALNAVVLVALLALLIREEIRFRRFRGTVAATREDLTNIAYQLRSPLGDIKKFSDFLQSKEFGAMSLSQQEALNNMHTSLGESLLLLDRLLARSHLDQGKVSMQAASINLAATVQGAIVALAPIIDDKHHTVTVTGGRSLQFFTDPILLHSIIDEVLANALYYTPDNGTIAIDLQEKNGRVIVEIRDNGIGISDEEQAQLFRKFFRGERARTMHNGNGLGLTFAKQFCAELGGTLQCRSSAKNGTVFTISLPK